jgi:hypothetical protein
VPKEFKSLAEAIENAPGYDSLGRTLYPGLNGAGFTDIKYKDKSVSRDLAARVDIITVNHFYRGSYGLTTHHEHACLQLGFWCWRQALTSPGDVYHYFICKLKKWRIAHAAKKPSR